MRKIIIDTDTGSDDAMGIIYALLHPNFDVLALTTVAGNVPLDLATKNAQYCADLCGQTIKIYKGASKPWVKDLETGQFAHGEDGMGDTNLPYGPARIEEMNAASALVKLVNENIGEIDIFAIGPLTNIAEAINLDPHFPEKVREL